LDEKSCNHLADIESVSPKTMDCKECEKEGVDWIALRLCLTCGNVGCCESSAGKHASKHFLDTGHPVMIALPNRDWKWCYVHKMYL